MGWVWTPYAFALLGSSLVSASLAGYGLVYLRRHGVEHSLVAFVALALSTAWWSLLDAVQMSLTSLDAKLVVWMANVGPGAVGAAWLLFAVTYTDSEAWLRRPALWVAVGGAVVYEFVVEPSTWVHRQVVTEWYLVPVENFYVLENDVGWLFSVWLVWGYGLVLAGLALFVRMALRNRGTLRTQALVVLAGTVVPLSLDVANQTGLLPFPDLNFSSIAFTLAAAVFAVAIFRYRLLDVAPVARDRVVERMRDGYLVVDGDGRVVDLNPAAGRFVDVDPDEAVGTPARTVLPGVPDPAPAAGDADADRAATASVDGGVPSSPPAAPRDAAVDDAGSGETTGTGDRLPGSWEFEVEVDGERRYVEADASPLEADDRLVGRLVVLRDVTDRRGVEKRYQALIENASDLITVVDRDGRIEFRSPSVRRVLGIARGGAGDATVFERLHPADSAEFRETFERLLDDPGGSERVEYRVRDADGEWRVLEAIATNLLETPFVEGVVINARDVTERKERERELERQNERLDEFASVVSHDLRNPLAVARGYVEVARETPDPGEPLDEVEASLDRMGAIIDDVLTLARQGESVGETETLSLASAANDAWGNVDAPAATLRVTADSDLEADRDRLLQLFENLFRNSLEHGSADVAVTVGEFDGGFFVADDGPGIPPGERDDVFESGYTTREDGTGFGLAIVERIAEAHGWSVGVTESEAGGARFEVRT